MNTFIRHGAYQYQVWRYDNNVHGRIAQLYMFILFVHLRCWAAMLFLCLLFPLVCTACASCQTWRLEQMLEHIVIIIYVLGPSPPISLSGFTFRSAFFCGLFSFSIVASLLRRLSCLLPSSLDWISSCPSCVYFCRFMFLVSLPSCPCRVPFHNLFCLLVPPLLELTRYTFDYFCMCFRSFPFVPFFYWCLGFHRLRRARICFKQCRHLESGVFRIFFP